MMISLEQVVLKMAAEIDQAKQTKDPNKIKQHARAIRLLADLILDGEGMSPSTTEQPSQSAFNEHELRQMMGMTSTSPQTPKNDYGQSDSKSIFDF